MQILFKNPKDMNDEEKTLLALTRLEFIKEGIDLRNESTDFNLSESSNAFAKAKLTLLAIKNLEKIKKFKHPEKLLTFPGDSEYIKLLGGNDNINLDIRISNVKFLTGKKLLDVMIGGTNEKTKTNEVIKESKPAEGSKQEKKEGDNKETKKNPKAKRKTTK